MHQKKLTLSVQFCRGFSWFAGYVAISVADIVLVPDDDANDDDDDADGDDDDDCRVLIMIISLSEGIEWQNNDNLY